MANQDEIELIELEVSDRVIDVPLDKRRRDAVDANAYSFPSTDNSAYYEDELDNREMY